MEKIRIRKPWDEQGSLALVRALTYLGVVCRFDNNNGQGAIIIELDDADDQALLRLWDELTDLRLYYIEAKQELMVTQMSYLEGDDAAAT